MELKAGRVELERKGLPGSDLTLCLGALPWGDSPKPLFAVEEAERLGSVFESSPKMGVNGLEENRTSWLDF